MAVGFPSTPCEFSDFTLVSSSPTESTALAAASLLKQTTSDVSSIWKIGSTLYALGGSFFNFSSYEIKNLNELQQCEDTAQAVPALHFLYKHNGKRLSSNIVEFFLKAVQEQCPALAFSAEGVNYLKGYIKKPFEIAEELHSRWLDDPSLTDFCIPYDNDGHHLVFYINIPNQSVEFYDPQGIPNLLKKELKEINSQLIPVIRIPGKRYILNDFQTFSLNDELLLIGKLFFDEQARYLVNVKPHQTCLFRCGLWGMYYIWQRVQKISFQEITQSSVDNASLDKFRIEIVAGNINSYIQSILIDARSEDDRLKEEEKARLQQQEDEDIERLSDEFEPINIEQSDIE